MKLNFCNIKLSYRLILLILVSMARHAQITQNNKFAKSWRKDEVRNEVEFLCIWTSTFSINWRYQFWWAWPGIPKVVKITNMQNLCDISRKNWFMKLMFYMFHIFYEFGQACPKDLGKFAMSWSYVFNCTSWLNYCSGDILCVQCSPTIESFPRSIWNACQGFSSFDQLLV